MYLNAIEHILNANFYTYARSISMPIWVVCSIHIIQAHIPEGLCTRSSRCGWLWTQIHRLHTRKKSTIFLFFIRNSHNNKIILYFINTIVIFFIINKCTARCRFFPVAKIFNTDCTKERKKNADKDV